MSEQKIEILSLNNPKKLQSLTDREMSINGKGNINVNIDDSGNAIIPGNFGSAYNHSQDTDFSNQGIKSVTYDNGAKFSANGNITINGVRIA